jgi:hypothetical protein
LGIHSRLSKIELAQQVIIFNANKEFSMEEMRQKYLGANGLVVLIALLSAFVPLSIDLYLPVLPKMSCVGYLAHPPRFVWLNRNFNKRYDANPSFRYISQKPKYKNPTYESRLFRCLLKMLLYPVPTGI